MRSIKINKIATIGLLMVLVIGFIQASKQGMDRRGADVELTLSTSPKLNEVFEVKAKIIGKKGLEDYAYYFPTYEFIAVLGAPDKILQILDKNEVYIAELRNGWIKEIIFRAKIIKLVPNVYINCALHPFQHYKDGVRITQVVDGVDLYLLDSLTGQYGTKEEYEGKLPVGYRYDPMDGSFTCSPSQNPAPVEENRRIIKMIKQFEPALSDSEALLLHSDQYRVGVPKGLPRWDEEKQRWIEEEIFEYYLNDGWFESLQEGRREAWIIQEREKIMKEVDKHKLNFFRDNNSIDNDFSSGNNSSPKERITTTFIGTWN